MFFTKKMEVISFREFLAGHAHQELPHKHYTTSMFAYTPISTDLLTHMSPEIAIGYTLVLTAGAIGFGAIFFDNYAFKNGLDEAAHIVENTIRFIMPISTFALFFYCLYQLINMAWW